MSVTIKRAAARKRNQPVDVDVDSEHSCRGDKANYITPEEEGIDVYRICTYENPRACAEYADFLKTHLDSKDEEERIARKESGKARKREMGERRLSRAKTGW